jgi:hypothetical protein
MLEFRLQAVASASIRPICRLKPELQPLVTESEDALSDEQRTGCPAPSPNGTHKSRAINHQYSRPTPEGKPGTALAVGNNQWKNDIKVP